MLTKGSRMQRLGLGLRRHAQLARQDFAAGLILLECQGAVALAGVESHQGPVHRLAQGVEGEQAPREIDGPFGLARRGQVIEQPAHDLLGQRVEARALARQPVLEGRIDGAEAFEQLAPVERNRARQGVRVAGGGQAFAGSAPSSTRRSSASAWRRLPRACSSARSLHRSPVRLSRERATPGARAR
jgi:hypothetical protein